MNKNIIMNMKRQGFIAIVFTLFSSIAVSQNDPVIMQINGKDIKKSEFEYIYKKNSSDEIIDKKSLQEYMELFKNFKLKVTEAEEQRLDTTQAFVKELKEYRDQLAAPYLSEIPADEDLIKKEYDRMKEVIEISHILISVPEKDSLKGFGAWPAIPSDTVAPYKKAQQIRKRLLKGEDFTKLVSEVSEDDRTAKSKNPGYIGWLTALNLPEPFEDGVYNTKKGEISIPVRSNFGYHIIKVLNRKQNPGQIRAAHIMVACPDNADEATIDKAKEKADSLYNLAMKGDDFAELAKKYSDDKGSGSAGGDLSWFGIGAMVPEFQDAAFALKQVGDIAKPVKSMYGFHIIKLLDTKPLESFDEKKDEITKRMERSERYVALREPGIENLKKEYGFSLDEKVYNKLKKSAETTYPLDSTFINKYENDSEVLFITGSTPSTIKDFIDFIKKNKSTPFTLSTEVLDERLFSFESRSLVAEKDKQLENRYPEFRNLMNEYRDGILLFEVSNNEVWNKASTDISGLSEFFTQNKNNYTWDNPHYKGYVVHCKDKKTMKRMMKEVNKLTPDSAANYLLQNYKVGDVSYVRLEKGLFVKGDNSYVDEAVFKTGKSEPMKDYPEFFVIGRLLNSPEDYTDVRGLVITDYQNYLEDNWIKDLNKRYPVIIYQNVVDTIN